MTRIVFKGIDFYLIILKTNIENAYLLSVYANTDGWIMAIYADFQQKYAVYHKLNSKTFLHSKFFWFRTSNLKTRRKVLKVAISWAKDE